MPKFLRMLMTGLAFLAFTLVGGVISYVLIPLSVLFIRERPRRSQRAQYILHRCSRIYIWWMEAMRLFRFRPPKTLPEAVTSGRGAMIIANHPALLDIIWMVSILPRATFLAKASWFRSPFIRPLLEYGGHLPGPETEVASDPAEGAMVLESMIEALSQGQKLVVFPEGTRSPARSLGSFHKGAFEAALRANVPLVCFLFQVDPPSLLKGQPWYEVPERTFDVNVSTLTVIEPREFPGSARALRQEVRARYVRALGLDASPPAEASEDTNPSSAA